MKKKDKIKVGFGAVVAVILAGALLYSVTANNPFNIGTTEESLYEEYRLNYVDSNGAVISNAHPVSWCPNSGIGCDNDITSEAVARLTQYAVLSNLKSDADLEVNFYYDHMRNPQTDFMMWKINNPSLLPASANSAVDAELIMIEAMLDADKLWGKDDKGRTYFSTATLLMNSLKEGVIDNKYLPFCMYAQGSESVACENKVFLGYVNLKTLKRMCAIDTYWCNVYTESKKIMIGAVKDNGIYSAYNTATGQYTYENAPIHTNWVMKQLLNDGSPETTSAVKAKYDQSRALFMADNKLCQEFKPALGCIETTPSTYVYADYLEMASYMNDKEFGLKLVDFIYTNRLQYDKPQDQYSNVAVFESLGYARRAWGGIE